MSWSHVSGTSSTVSGTSISPLSLPASLQDGDLVVYGLSFTPDDGSRDLSCTTSGWRRVTEGGDRSVYAIYNSSLSGPAFDVTGGSLSLRYSAQAYRATNTVGFGSIINVAGNPPVASDVVVTALETLIILIGTTPGSSAWTVAPAGFTSRTNSAVSPSLYFGDRIENSTGTVSGIQVAATGAARNIILPFGEEGSVNAFFF